MPFSGDPRRRYVVLLASGVGLILVLLGAMQAFNTSNISFLNPDTFGATLLFTSLTGLVFLLLLLLLLLLLRNILKVYAGQGSSGLGARLRSRMVLGAVLIALTPAVFMFLFSYQLMNRSLDRWFSPNASELREDSTRVVAELAQYVAANARVEAESIAASGAPDRQLAALQAELAAHRITLAGGFAVVYGKNQQVLSNFQAPAESSPASLHSGLDEGERSADIPLHGPLTANLLDAAQRPDQPVMQIAGQEYAVGLSVTASGKVVVVALPMPQGLGQTVMRIRSGSATYRALFLSRNRIRTTFFLMLLLITVFVFFSSVWVALFLSKQITRPVEALAVAMAEIATGKHDHRVELAATGEMGELVRAFNHMAADLDASRQLAESSSAQLTAANMAIEERRRELETIVETIPSGVVTLDGAGTILQSNRAFAALLGRCEEPTLSGKKIESLFPAEAAEDLAGVIRRGQRMGAASAPRDALFIWPSPARASS